MANRKYFALANDAAEDAVAAFAQRVVDDVAKTKKTQGAHAALVVPGLCHSHEPTTAMVRDCAYCLRRGNVFAENSSDSMDSDSATRDAPPDVIERRVDRIRAELLALAADIERLTSPPHPQTR